MDNVSRCVFCPCFFSVLYSTMTKQCSICNKGIKRRIHVDDKPILLSATRTTCHECVPYKSRKGRPHNTSRRKEVDGLIMRQCSKCDKWRGSECYHREVGLICKSCYRKHYTSAPRRCELKMRAVVYKGSSCQRCQQVFPLCAYSFHHLDPSEKDFQISHKGGGVWDKIVAELDKCELLCHNCHSIRHVVHEEFLEKPDAKLL